MDLPVTSSNLSRPAQGGEEARSARAEERNLRRSRDALVRANLLLVYTVANRYRHLPVPLDDLIQEGTIGLIKAVAAYDPRRGTRLSSLAMPYIRGAMQRSLRDRQHLVRVPRSLFELGGRVDQLQEQRRQRGERSLGVAALAAQLSSSPALVREAIDARLCQSPRSLDAPLRGGDGDSDGCEALTWLDQLPDPAIGSDGDPGREPAGEGSGEADRQGPELAWLHEQLAHLNPRLRRLVEERVLVGCSWSELGQRFGMHPKMAERRCGVLLDHLRRSAAIWQQERQAMADQPAAGGHSSPPAAIASSAAARV